MGISGRLESIQEFVQEPAWRAIPAWLMGRRTRHHVTGHSMEPVVRPGDTVLVKPLRMIHDMNDVQVGDLIVLPHPGQPERIIIKQITDIRRAIDHSTTQVFVSGTRPEASTDSRVFGWIDVANISGKVTYHISHTLSI